MNENGNMLPKRVSVKVFNGDMIEAECKETKTGPIYYARIGDIIVNFSHVYAVSPGSKDEGWIGYCTDDNSLPKFFAKANTLDGAIKATAVMILPRPLEPTEVNEDGSMWVDIPGYGTVKLIPDDDPNTYFIHPASGDVECYVEYRQINIPGFADPMWTSTCFDPHDGEPYPESFAADTIEEIVRLSWGL
jgi:hypothetical protein